MNISHTIILTLCFLLFNYCIHSQKNINNSDRLLYIPYNEYGKWGWCDTLGNIVIEPKYLLTDFFHKSRYKNKLLAQVDTKSGINFIDKNGRLIIPKRFKTGEKFYQKYENTSGEIENRELLLIENKSSKKGLYDLVSESVVVPVKYDSIFSINHSGVGHIYIKGQEQTLLKLEEGSFRLEKTTTLKISQYLDFRDLGEIIVFEQVNGETIITKNGRKMDRREYEDMIEEIKAREKELFIQEIPEEEIRTEFTGSGRDRILEVLEYGQSALEYGFIKLEVIRRSNKLGLINENGEIILPVEYDKMIFDEDNIEIELYKNGKVGRMILFSPYSVIDAQYDQVFYGKILKTSRDRYFTVFKIKQGTNYGYVGENGVEYFRF